MHTYVLSILSASLLAAVVERLAPGGEGGRVGAHVRTVAGLFVLVTLLTPIKEGLSLLRNVAEGGLSERVESLLAEKAEGNYGQVLGDTLTAVSQGELESYTLSALESQFGVPPSGCQVSVVCVYEEETLTITEARICLLGRYALQDPHPIEAFFGELYGCPCYVTVGSE